MTENAATNVFQVCRVRPLLLAIAMLGVSCRNDMYNQPKKKALAESEFFQDGTNARPLPANVVPYGEARENAAFFTGLTNGTYITQLPVNLSVEFLGRGRE